MRSLKLSAVLLASALAAACAQDAPTALISETGPSLHGGEHGSGPLVEPAWYNGEEYLIQVPSASSANPNVLVVACFRLGPQVPAGPPAGRMHVIFAPNSTQHEGCPPEYGPPFFLPHDHVLSAVPGVPGYVPRWEVLVYVPGPNWHPGVQPTSEAEVAAAVAAEELVFATVAGRVLMPVIGRSHHHH
jgi:hypothetical protein